MPKSAKNVGQRTNLSTITGVKERTPTSRARTGSRVDPSHAVQKARTTRAKKVAAKKA